MCTADEKRLVIKVVHPHRDGPYVRELLDAGMDGLKKAKELFDPSKGGKFSTYAIRWVDSAVKKKLKELLNEGSN